MSDYMSVTYILFEILGYKLSLIEAIGTVTGIIAVVLATQSNIWSWAVGLVNFIFAFWLFYQVHLYSDMLLQVYYFVVGIYGWIYWYGIKSEAQTPITLLSKRARMIHIILLAAGSVGLGFFMTHIHTLLPKFFPTPAAFPYTDALVTVLSVLANWMLAQRKIENWVMWIVTDVICTVLFYQRGIYFFSLEYLLFTGMALYGLLNWIKLYKRRNYTAAENT